MQYECWVDKRKVIRLGILELELQRKSCNTFKGLSTTSLYTSKKGGSQNKHINIKYLTIREHVNLNKVAIEHMVN